jgi:catecholate siderophore receptor
LSQVTVNPAPRKPQQRRSAVQVSRPSAPPPSAPPPSAIQLAWPSSGTQDARTGTVGIYANSTSVATKVNTPIVNIPQSLTVVTREFINDNSFQNLTDITRFVPGVAIHQGEGNRDELVIRGVDSSANFFVNGFRDDVQYFRDLYNAQAGASQRAIDAAEEAGAIRSIAAIEQRGLLHRPAKFTAASDFRGVRHAAASRGRP